MNLAATVGWRIPHAGPPAPPPGGYYGGTSGVGLTPTLPEPTQLMIGDGLLLFVLHEDRFVTPTLDLPGWGSAIGVTHDSSDCIGLSIYGRTADGTATDAMMSFTMPGSQQSSWGVIAVHGLTDPVFPGSLAGSGVNYKFVNSKDPGSCTVSPSAPLFAIAGLMIVATTGTGASPTGDPSGYTAAITSPSFNNVTPTTGPANSCTAWLALSYKTLVGTTEDPGAFSDGTGCYTGLCSGGNGALTMLVSYTP